MGSVRPLLVAVLALGTGQLVVAACGSEPALDAPVAETADADAGAVGAADADAQTSSGGLDVAERPCAFPPRLVAPTPDAGVFCRNSHVDGGRDVMCALGQVCCQVLNDAGAPSSCVASTQNCGLHAVSLACDGPMPCGDGRTCCATATGVDNDPSCPHYLKAVGFTRTTCAASCAAADYVVCNGDADCPAGKRCTPLKAWGTPLGFCL